MDFTNLPRKNKTYAGANGSKIAVELNGSLYMLKFPSLPKRNKDMSYTSSREDQAPQSGHFPDHLLWTDPQAAQRKTFGFFFATRQN